jgi:hypothetical protein
MRKIVTIVATLAVLGLIGGVTLASASSTAPQRNAWGIPSFPGAKTRPASPEVPRIDEAETLVLFSRGGSETDVDEPPAGESQGDEFTVHQGVFNELGTRVGQLDVHGTESQLSRRQVSILISFTVSLSNGEIDADGVGSFTRTTAELDFGVTGGTGHYQNVRGEVHLEFLPHNAVKATYHLIP